MNSYTMKELLSGYFEERYLAVDEAVVPELSLRHKRKMKKAFRIFEKNTKAKNADFSKPVSVGKRLVFAAIIIVSLAFLTGAVVMYIVPGFQGVVHPDNLHLFAVDTTEGEDEIKYVYDFPEDPKGYMVYEKYVSPFYVYMCYMEEDFSEGNPYENSSYILLTQHLKDHFNIHMDNERHTIIDTTVNGHNGIFSYEYFRDDWNCEDRVSSTLIWDNGDFILRISTNVPVEEEDLIFELSKMLVTIPAEYTPIEEN